MATSNPLTEHDFQRMIIDHLVGNDGYIERDSNTCFDPAYSMDVGLFLDFLERTQHDSMERIRSAYDGGWRATLLNRVANEIGSKGLISCLWDGVPFESGIRLDLVEPRPSALFDKKASKLYRENVLSVEEEVYHKSGERIDLVVFLNGIAIFTFELKCPTAGTGWTYRDAIAQYKEERDCTTRLLTPRVGALAHFAMDTEEVWVCTELRGGESRFLPFNRGVDETGGDGVRHTGAGNPPNPDGPRTSYMWEEVLTEETVFDLIYDFCYVETKRDKKTHKVTRRNLIFPRYHQLRAARRISDDIVRNGSSRNYLVEHSAGSGKTKTICWLAHRLSSMYREGGTLPYFDKVLIVTDRRVVDSQLQDAALDMAKDRAVVRVMDRDKTSRDLGRALHSNYRIVVTTMAKFLYLDPGTFDGEGKRFAVLVDEAHGSTSGKTMEAINGTLSDLGGNGVVSSLEEVDAFLREDAARSGRQSNVALIGFTATPTARTLELFGTLNTQGKHEAFDLYSMRQAIEEGFILDVTSDYTTYDTYCKVRKTIENDPELETRAARRQMLYMRQASELGIEAKLQVIAEHFTGTVRDELGGRAKAMIVASSRLAAVRYFRAYERMRAANARTLGDARALVAFTDEVEDEGERFTEAGLNGMPEDRTADAFDTDDYRILIVADKFQTGFDQPLLAAMYVDKPLSGVAAVQTLSRLNRICPPYDKRTFVLDFANDYERIRESFAPYYESTILEEGLTMDDVRETERRLLGLGFLDVDEVEEYNSILARGARTNAQKGRMMALLSAAKGRVEGLGPDGADEARRTMRAFVRQYSFMLQVEPFVNERMHGEYNFCTALARMLRGDGGIKTYVLNKVSIEDFEVSDEPDRHEGQGVEAKPGVRMAKGTGTGLTESQYERLSRIVADWNARYGKNFDAKIAAGSLVSLKGSLESDPKVVRSARVNTKRDFRNTVEDQTEDALVRGYEQNQDWYGFLLENREARSELLRAFADDIYEAARKGDADGSGSRAETGKQPSDKGHEGKSRRAEGAA
ncbi:MAG: DEAD/DEAH box helicase family protein [Atopobiaceae bacterium]|jgi:type I restriction enzyme R subunit|nr:DEAD/DEAH box helicase family protein [Atopobiaceae bacterium]MCH4119090.1 DEAD/DEAH box helicase family protein [Atopobiaceae bacterium]MCI1318176.1 DEAD/DEAH box helicase family protein [Atopobiaceae bacterium]MCI1388651.1 DEAD/DEAH box helicase family protein [Atopobiaceae bacterium]MCI1432150.1 DEAD/DEAH box helicase family protein [Atopobiaceae bacterium]